MFRARVRWMGRVGLAVVAAVAVLDSNGWAGEPIKPAPKISGPLASRSKEARNALVEAHGGSKDTERAVAAALNWLARHQAPDGRWSLADFSKQCKDPVCTGGGSAKSDAGATALGLLPFLAAGQTHLAKGPYQQVVRKGLSWLMKNQERNGNLAGDAQQMMYSHGLATIALGEAYGLTKDRMLALRAQQAVVFIEEAQHAKTGGWRYVPGQEGDTSVLGWQVAALKSAQMSGLAVNPKTLEGARKWLKSVAHGDRQGLYSYMPNVGERPSMTAVGLLSSQWLGAKADDPAIGEGVACLQAEPPDHQKRDIYYWYYATQAMYNLGGPAWDQWNQKMRSTLVETQVKEGCAAGSWDPDKPTQDRWGAQGGRLMVTSLSCLSLEVYYRYLRVYQPSKAKP